MRGTIVFILSLFLLSAETGFAQKPSKSAKREDSKIPVEIGGGVMGSVLYLGRNIKEKNDALGYSVSGNYGGNKLCRLGLQYTYYKPINIEPTWYNVRAHTLEANLELIARFKDQKSYLYPFVGVSYNTFKGYFTGLNDFLGLREYYPANSTQTDRWLGVNLGTGFEHAFGPVVLYLDYRMRVGLQKQFGNKAGGINIMDVCYGAGLRFKLSSPPLHKIFRGLGDRYHWF